MEIVATFDLETPFSFC